MKMLGAFVILILQSNAVLAAPVSEQLRLDVGGNELYLDVSGQRADAPLLVYLHGGPGHVVLGVLPFQSNVGSRLEADFLVAYLHQRGAGKSSPVRDSEQTFSNHIDDVDRVVDLLTDRYGQEKVHLVGHSWGGTLAVLYADGHRDKVEKLVLVASAINVKSQLRDSYDATLAWASQEELPDAIEALSEIDQSFENWSDVAALSRWASQARGGLVKGFDIAEFFSDQITDDYPDWNVRQADISRAMSKELLNLDLDSVSSSLEMPALFISGKRDTIVAERTVRRDYRNYGGEKAFVLLEESHHLPFIDQPDALAEAIRQFLSE
jgi:proline iminopeptidase